ncbi:NERD domain-containing protein [Catellatospora sp. KI3]|uniref:NERD domain-containing protein n=1 Tax=Catellatospora sp. KI3 TaxID=3041620 RepID=UPI002482C18B|nr:NERD domain-containing protein [Catellatospora sp. KI3]MDI1461733.1 NERD domain-containing protein [Catellatospora sp. KI3]
MTVYPDRAPLGRPTFGRPAQPVSPSTDVAPAPRVSPLAWARQRRTDRALRLMSATEDRAIHRLGRDWHVIEWPHLPELARTSGGEPGKPKQPPAMGFMAIGPGGIFSVSLAQHGRSRVLIAGDVVQIGGRRPPYISQARRDAKRVAKAISAAIGQDVKVFAVLAFLGSGPISVNGLPKECIVTSFRELDRVLESTGSRISHATAAKLSQVARNPAIWVNQPYPGASGYTWHPEGSAPGDKGTQRG